MQRPSPRVLNQLRRGDMKRLARAIDGSIRKYSKSLGALICIAALAACDQSATRSITEPNAAKPVSQLTPTPLTGESLVGTVAVTGNCTEGTGGYSFIASGAATGPYPGTFDESGGFVVSPGGSNFTSQFTINSIPEITGYKSGSLGGQCTSDQFVQLGGFVPYQANIGGVPDFGMALVDLIANPDGTGQLNEIFFSSAQAFVILEPVTAVNPVGTSHTVTATVIGSASGQPQPGVIVFFAVSSPIGFGASGECTTDANGRCTFTYQGPQQPDVETISGCPENVPGQCGYATKVFVIPPSTPGQVTGGGQIIHNGIIRGVSFGFNAQLNNDSFHGSGVVVDHQTKTQIKILNVDYLLITGHHATFRGDAEVDGTPTRYTIDVDDLATPGLLRDTFKIVTESGYAAAGPLTQGNIDIHN